MPTITSIRAARSSYLMPMEIVRLPRRSHSKALSMGSPCSARITATTAMTAAVKVETSAAMPPARRKKRAITAAETSGSTKTKRACWSMDIGVSSSAS